MANARIGALRIDLGMNTAAFEKGTTLAQRELKKLQKQTRKIGRQMRDVGKGMSMYLTAPIVGFAASTAKVAGDFEASMNKVAAVSNASAGELEALTEKAKEMGRTTQFSASQSADALSFLAMAGFSANEAIEALPGTLQLAAAAQMDLGEAADIVSNVLTGYNLEIKELGRVNDVLVKTFTNTNTNLQDLGEAMKYAGPVASAAGMRFEEAAAAIGLMGNAGIQASMAGTSLRGATARMLDPKIQSKLKAVGVSVLDANGRLRSLTDIIQQLEPHADNAGLFMEIFGLRAGPAMAALVSQGSGELDNLIGKLDESGGTAQRIADKQMEGFNGAMKRMASAFEGLQIAMAESGFLDALTDFAEGLANAFQWLGELSPATLKWITIIGGVVAILGPVVFTIGALVSGFAALAPLLPLIATGISGIGIAIKILLGPIGWVIAAVGALYYAWKNWDKIEPVIRKLYNDVKRWIMDKLKIVFDWLKGKLEAVTGFFKDMYIAVVGNSYVPDMVDGIQDHFARLQSVMVDPAERAAKSVKEAMRDMAQEANSLMRQLFPLESQLFDIKKDMADLERYRAAGLISDAAATAGRARLRQEAADVRRQRRGDRGFTVLGDYSVDKLAIAADGLEKITIAVQKLPRALTAAEEEVVRFGRFVGDEIMQSAFDFLSGRGSFREVLARGLNNMFEAALGAALKGLESSLFGDGGLGGFFGDLLGSFFGGGRAMGGQVSMGKTYLVGEKGPELFSPSTNGKIHKAGTFGKGGGTVINVDARGSTDPEAVRAQVRQGIIEAAPQIIAASEARTIRTLRRPTLAGGTQ